MTHTKAFANFFLRRLVYTVLSAWFMIGSRLLTSFINGSYPAVAIFGYQCIYLLPTSFYSGSFQLLVISFIKCSYSAVADYVSNWVGLFSRCKKSFIIGLYSAVAKFINQ